MADIALPKGVRQNLLSMQSTVDLVFGARHMSCERASVSALMIARGLTRREAAPSGACPIHPETLSKEWTPWLSKSN